MKTDRNSILAFSIILLGFFLRVYHLGDNSFWSDEAITLEAATQPTIRKMIGYIRSHAMAMPADYIVTRIVSYADTSEFILRFPSAIWGTLTLIVCHRCVKLWYDKKIALFCILLLAISPTLIHYSQELRFYSALICFYSLSNFFLFRAIVLSSKSSWFIYSVVTLIGGYFHPYVLLSAVNGFLYLAFFGGTLSKDYKKFILLIVSTLFAIILILPGYLVFSGGHKFHYGLFQWGQPLFLIFYGLGWRAMHSSTPIMGMWELLNISFVIIGLLFAMVNIKKNRFVLSMAIGAMLQIGIIILLDWNKGYWFLPRQLVYLIPTTILLIGAAYAGLLDFIKVRNSGSSVRAWCTLIIISLFTLSSLPRLFDYYFEYTKSTAREIAQKLIEIHTAGDPVLIIPWFEKVTFRFYLLKSQKGQNIFHNDLRAIDWKQLPSAVTESSKTTYLITNKFRNLAFFSREDQEKREILTALKFKECFVPEKQGVDTQILYVRE